MAVVAMMVGFITLLVIKLVPPYLEHAKVSLALRNAVKQSGGASSESADEIRRAIQRRFDIEDVRVVDLKRDLRFERRRAGYMTVRITYEVRIPIAYNVSAMIAFDDDVEVRSN